MTPTPDPDYIPSLIEQAEKAETYGDVWCAFNKTDYLLKRGGNFKYWIDKAFATTIENRALGYLLLAAMELVPQRRGGNLAGFLHHAFWQSSIGDISDDRIAITLLIACLKAMEAKDG